MKFGNLAGILAASLALAGYSSWVLAVRERDRRLPAVDDTVAGIPLVSMSEAYALWQDDRTLFVDVRSAENYDVGHIAGAISLPADAFAERFPALKSRLEHTRAVVVYCKSRDCGQSLWTAIRLRQQGLTQTRIYPNGWNEWVTHDLPTDRPKE